MSALLRAGQATVAALVVAAAAMGALHTPWGRPLLSRIGLGCPAGRATPEQVEALRQRGLTELRGDALSPARPALGFELGSTTREGTLAWAAAHHLDCAIKKRGGDAVFCRDVPKELVGEAFAGGPVEELAFFFAPDGLLVQVETMRRDQPAAEAEALLAGIVEKLTPVLGAPTDEVGERTAEYLGAGGAGVAVVKYRFADYLVIVNAMHLREGVTVRERYVSATAAPPAAPPKG